MTITVQSPARAPEAPGEPPIVGPAPSVPWRRIAFIGGGAIVALGLALRFWTLSDLWLDEALTVNVAKLPFGQITGALRHDGAPPLYYWMLHFWMVAFGQSDFAVRAFSGLASVIALPLVWVVGLRLGGRACAWATLLLVATSPFAITYATAARMYALMVLWSLLGLIALVRAIEQPTLGRLAVVAGSTALLIYTHYWGLYLVAAAGLWLLLRAHRGRATITRSAQEERRVSWRCVAAIVAGCATFLPWLPSFAYQSMHTGTPWANPAGPGDILGVLGEYAGGGPEGAALGLSLFALLLLGLFGRPIDESRVLLELRIRRRARPIAWMFIGTLGFAVVAGAIDGAAFVGRYTSLVFPLFMLLAGLGASVLLNRKVMAGVLVVASVFGLIVAVNGNATNRTEASKIAAVINKGANPGDLVVYCPDQLGPAVDRLLKVVGLRQATFPRGSDPSRVDWVDYRKAMSDTSVDKFGQDMVARSGGHAIWFVWQAGYPGTDHKCTQLGNLFQSIRPVDQELVQSNASTYFEHEALVRYAA